MQRILYIFSLGRIVIFFLTIKITIVRNKNTVVYVVREYVRVYYTNNIFLRLHIHICILHYYNNTSPPPSPSSGGGYENWLLCYDHVKCRTGRKRTTGREGPREMTASFSVRGSLSAALYTTRVRRRGSSCAFIWSKGSRRRKGLISCILHPRFTIPRRISLVLFKLPKCAQLVSEG